MSNLAIFDLDNTLINTDSDHAWPQFMVEKGFLNEEYVLEANERFYRDYQNGCLSINEFLRFQLEPLRRFSADELDNLHREFMDKYIRPHITPMARSLVANHRDAGDELLVISSTNEFIITPICHEFGISNIIGTQPERDENGYFTGGYIGTPSLQEGKIIRLNEWLSEKGKTLSDYEKVYFYSDSKNDLPLLHHVNHPIVVNPDTVLQEEAHKNGWPILNFKEAA